MADDRLDAISTWADDPGFDMRNFLADVRWLVAQLEDARADADRLADELERYGHDNPYTRAALAEHRAAVQRRGQ